jgi:hypothetical protein
MNNAAQDGLEWEQTLQQARASAKQQMYLKAHEPSAHIALNRS